MTHDEKSNLLAKEMNIFYTSQDDIYKERDIDSIFRIELFNSIKNNDTSNIGKTAVCTYLTSFFTILIKISHREKHFTYCSTYGETSLETIIHDFNNHLEIDYYRDRDFTLHITSILYPPRSVNQDKISSRIKGNHHFEPGIDGIMLKHKQKRHYITTDETLENNVSTASELKNYLNQKFGSLFISKCNIFLFRSKDYILTSSNTFEIFCGKLQCSGFGKDEITHHTLKILSSLFISNKALAELKPIFYNIINNNKETNSLPKNLLGELNKLYTLDPNLYTLAINILCKEDTKTYRKEINLSLEKVISDTSNARDWDPLTIIGLLNTSKILNKDTLALLDNLVFEKIAQDSNNKNITQTLINFIQERESSDTRNHAIRTLITTSLGAYLTKPIDFNRAPYKNWVGKVKSNNDFLPRRSSRAMLTNMYSWMLQDKHSDAALDNIILFLWSELAYNKPYCESSLFSPQEPHDMNIKNTACYITFFMYAYGILQDGA